MPIVEPPPPYDALEGVNLYHASISNCSQRCRIALEEKGVPWESRYVDITRNEHLTPEYQALHPGGVVPALVHDGKAVLDSNDIIVYVDETFDGPSLLASDREQAATTRRLLTLSGRLQEPLRLLSFTYLFADRLRKSPEQLAEYEKRQGDGALVDWHRRFSTGGFSSEDVADAAGFYADCLGSLDELLAGQDWLSGRDFGLADISWTVNARRAEILEHARPGLLRLESFERLEDWFSRIRSRPGYRKGLVEWEPDAMRAVAGGDPA